MFIMGSKRAWEHQVPRLLVYFPERTTEPARPMGRGIKSTRAPSHSGEDLNAPQYIHRSAGKWDT